MNKLDSWFHTSINRLWNEGEIHPGRNGNTRTEFGTTFDWDMRDGFPLLTGKKTNGEAAIGETLSFLHGVDTAGGFRLFGVNFWDANAKSDYWLNNPNHPTGGDLDCDTPEEYGPLGRIYGVQWRDWRGAGIGEMIVVDQLQNLLAGIRKDPYGRRHIVTAWQPAELDQMALPPCHVFFQVYCHADNGISLQMYQRSADSFLGVPYNIAGYAFLLELLAKMTGRTAKYLKIRFGDFHFYEVHEVEDKALTKLNACAFTSPAYTLPTLNTKEDLREVDFSENSMSLWATPTNFSFSLYNHGPFIPARMVE